MSDWVDKIDLNLTGQSFTDEKHTDVGASAFQLDHDWFWGGADLVIRTASGGGGTLLVEGTDYQLSVQDTDLTTRSGKTVYGKVQIITPGYQTGDLFFSGKYIADSNEAPDINDLYAIINRRLGLNDIINGGFRFWQRGTSFAAMATGAYSADRWQYAKVSTAIHTITRDADVPSDDLPYSLKIDCTTADAAVAAGDYVVLQQKIEGWNFDKYRGNYGTLSFWVKATKTGIYCMSFRCGGWDRSYVTEYTVNIADIWEKKTITVQFNYTGGTWNYTNGIGLALVWTLMCGSTFHTTKDAWQTGDYFATSSQVNACDNVANDFRVTGMKFELGQKATDFITEDFDRERSRCERYYEKSYDLDVVPGTASELGCLAFTQGPSVGRIAVKYATRKRIGALTAVGYSPATGAIEKYRDYSSGADFDITAYQTKGESQIGIDLADHGAPDEMIALHWTADAEL